MENEIKKEVDTTTNVETTQPFSYEEINKYVNQKVENEVGKFIKTFLENNNTTTTIKVEPTETQEEKELKEWVI